MNAVTYRCPFCGDIHEWAMVHEITFEHCPHVVAAMYAGYTHFVECPVTRFLIAFNPRFSQSIPRV